MASLPGADQNGYPYEVFLSFRGKDTRFAFTGHLYKALCDRGIMTFRDDDELGRGEEISPALLKAIEESRASIIVFSENYASSWWCLDELVKILECRKSKGQEVRSVFYKVDPSDVRHQTGSVGEAFAKLDQCKYKDSLDRWRAALREAADLSGWPFTEGEYESEFIDKIVGELSARVVNPSYELPVAEHPVGIEFCRREIEILLDVEEENAVRMVGIWGTGGIGKTTIAQDVYNSIRHKFEGSCFLAVDGTNSSPDQSLAKLQETLLFGILRDPTLEVRNVDEGISFIKKKMRKKKVLLILDDVSDSNQLKKLAPSSECFGPGSRIIITTRDKRWLTAHQVDSIYEVKVLNNDGALELFSWHAFKCNGPPDDFLEPAKDAVHYAQGLPLALIVLGSHLFKRSRDEWEAILDSCKGEPQRQIQSVLRRSYDALNDCAKELFLDIACFFKGTSVDKARAILQACGRNPTIGMKLLAEKALIRIDGDEIWMHDLIEEMGKEIVHQEAEPGQRSRLWNHEDIKHVLRDNTGTNKIEGIQVRWQWGQWGDNEICLNAKSFSQMKNLRYFSSSGYLNAKGIQEHYSGNIDFLSTQLRWFNWPKCPIQFFPLNFYPKKLVALNIPSSCITRLWQGRKNFPYLISMNLSGCASLMELPDFTRIPNLKELNLYGCTSLVEVHCSVGSLSRLENLYVDHCSNLVTLPRAFSLKSVQTISLINCKRLEEFPKIVGNMDSLRCLDLLGSGIKELDPSIGNLIGLKRLDLSGCQNLTTLPSSIDKLKNLETLDLSKCSKLATFPEIDREMGVLRKLDLSDRDIKELHPSIGNLIGIKDLSLRWCKNLTTLPCSIDGLQNLENLDLSGCSNLATFPEINRKMASLRKLDLSNSGIKELHPSIGNLIVLEELFLNGCENLSKLPCNIYRWQNLERLFLSRCSKLVTFPRNTKGLPDDDNGDGLSLPKLKELIMKGCNLSDGDFLMTFDCVETLTKLDLSSNSFVSLPACISKFVNLEKLDLHCCKRLREIPELPPNLVEVDVSDCDSLEKFWKLSKVLEGKESQGIRWINLWNCNRLCNILEYNMDRLERILLNNQNNSPFGVVFPGSTSEVPKWFDCREEVIGNENGHRNLFEFSIRISENLKWEKIGLAICAVFERGNEYCCDYEVSINKVCIRPLDLYYLRTSKCIISRSDHVWLYYIPLPVERKAEVDDQKGGSSPPPPYYNCRVKFREKAILDNSRPKSCGVHLVCQQSKDDEYSSNKVGGGGVEPTEQKRHRGANDTSLLESQNHQQKKHCGPNSM